MFVERLSIAQELIGEDQRASWPFTIPCVRSRRYLSKAAAYLRHLIDPGTSGA